METIILVWVIATAVVLLLNYSAHHDTSDYDYRDEEDYKDDHD